MWTIWRLEVSCWEVDPNWVAGTSQVMSSRSLSACNTSQSRYQVLMMGQWAKTRYQASWLAFWNWMSKILGRQSKALVSFFLTVFYFGAIGVEAVSSSGRLKSRAVIIFKSSDFDFKHNMTYHFQTSTPTLFWLVLPLFLKVFTASQTKSKGRMKRR